MHIYLSDDTLEKLTCDSTFCSGGWASAFLSPWKVFAISGECRVSRLPQLVATGRGAVWWWGRLVAAVGRVAVAWLRARAGAGWADVGYYASWWTKPDRAKKESENQSLGDELFFLIYNLHFSFFDTLFLKITQILGMISYLMFKTLIFQNEQHSSDYDIYFVITFQFSTSILR